MPAPIHPNTGPATEASVAARAASAAADPVKLARAARIVRAALARQLLTVADLLPSDGAR